MSTEGYEQKEAKGTVVSLGHGAVSRMKSIKSYLSRDKRSTKELYEENKWLEQEIQRMDKENADYIRSNKKGGPATYQFIADTKKVDWVANSVVDQIKTGKLWRSHAELRSGAKKAIEPSGYSEKSPENTPEKEGEYKGPAVVVIQQPAYASQGPGYNIDSVTELLKNLGDNMYAMHWKSEEEDTKRFKSLVGAYKPRTVRAPAKKRKSTPRYRKKSAQKTEKKVITETRLESIYTIRDFEYASEELAKFVDRKEISVEGAAKILAGIRDGYKAEPRRAGKKSQKNAYSSEKKFLYY